jgi:hypothetical protein
MDEDEIKEVFEEATGDIVHEITVKEGPRGPSSYFFSYFLKL